MQEEKLIRGIGRWDLTAIAINCIIGSGIFGLPSTVYGLVGSYSLFALIACAVMIGFIVLCYAEVSSRFEATGGPYLFAKEAFGSVTGFEVGWLFWVALVTSFVANINLIVTYLSFFFPSATDGWVRITIIGLVILSLTVVNFVGIRESAVVTNIFAVGKILPLVFFIGVGLFFVQTENFDLRVVPKTSSFAQAILPLVFAFAGFEGATIMAGETKDARRNMPAAILIAIAFVTVLYLLIQVVAIGTLPGLAASEKPLADAAVGFMGPVGASVIAAGAAISVIGNLNVGVLRITRLLFAMGENRELPAVLSRTHSRFKTPYVSLVLNAIIVFVLAAYSSFLTAVTLATISRLLIYATTCLSLPVFRRRGDAPEAKFKAPLGVAACLLSIGLIVWLLANVDFTKEGLPIVIATVIGLVIYGVNRFFSARTA